MNEVEDRPRRRPWCYIELAQLIQTLMLAATLNGCGSSTGNAAVSPTKEETPPPGAGCFTDPGQLALQAATALRDVGIAGMTPPFTMEEERFKRFAATLQVPAENAEGLWQMHRSDLDLGEDFLKTCDGGPLTVEEVEREEAAFEAYDVSGFCTATDGSKTQFKVEQIGFEGCLYVGNIE